MRFQFIYHLIKHDMYNYRRIILSCFLIPLVLVVIIMWKHDLFMTMIHRMGHLTWMVEMIFVVIFILAFLTMLITLTVRLRAEERFGFYKYMRTLPVTPEEIVTAKFLMSFFVMTGTLVWLLLLWWGVTYSIPSLDRVTTWSYIYKYGLFFPIWLAFHHGQFFRLGAQESWSVHFILVAIFYMTQQPFAQKWLEKFQHVLFDQPWIMIGGGSVCLIAVWILCWRWAIRSYRSFYKSGRKGVTYK